MEKLGHGPTCTFFDGDIPVIGTCAARVQYLLKDGRRIGVHEGERSQVDSRLLYIPMTASLQDGDVAKCSPCARCAAELYSLGKPS